MVEGRIEYRQWEDKDKVKKYATEILGENIQMGPKSAGVVGAPKTAEEAFDEEAEQKGEAPIIEGDEIDLKDVQF
jgi:single-stranded DNA-binding protein